MVSSWRIIATKIYHVLSEQGVQGLWRKVKSRLTCCKEEKLLKKERKWYEQYYARHLLSGAELEKQRSEKFQEEPVISIIVPVYNTPRLLLVEMLESVTRQSYINWELCIADGNSINQEVRTILKEYAACDSRIKVTFLTENEGIVGNSNEAALLATGEYLALLDHDDQLAPDALYQVVKAINENGKPDVLYTDEDQMDSKGIKHFEPHFKPDWALDTLRSINYICHLFVLKKELFQNIGRFRAGFDGSQDYDLILRATEKADKIVHIPKILYHWRAHQASTAADLRNKMYAFDAAKKALSEHLQRMQEIGIVKDGQFLSSYQIQYKTKLPGLTSIILFGDLTVTQLKGCLESVKSLTPRMKYEILLVAAENMNEKLLQAEQNVRVVAYPEKPDNTAAICNFCARVARGELLIFLDGSLMIQNEDWLERMLEHAMRQEIGAVGCKIYNADHTIFHGGYKIGHPYFVKSVLGQYLDTYTGQYEKLRRIQNVSAVSEKAFMTAKKTFERLGGFAETLPHKLYAADYCLRAQKEGMRIVWTPFAAMKSAEGNKEATLSAAEKEEFQARWGDAVMQGDRYHRDV